MNVTARHNWLSFSCLISTVFLLISCSSKENKIKADAKPSAPPPARVDGYIVKTRLFSQMLELPGSLIANEATEIHPEIAGRLTYLNAAEGKMVSQGTLLARIYDGDLKAQLSKLNVQLQVQEQTIKRYEELLKINGVSQQEYDLIVLQSNNIKADISIVKSNIQRTEIRAPFTGTLGLRMISPGAYVSPQTVITTIRQNNQLKLDFTLPEKFTSHLQTGQLINFTAEGNPKTYKAKVLATESGLDESNRSLQVRSIVMNNDGKLLPGVFVKVNLGFDADPNTIMIPTQAVLPQARGKQVVVYNGGSINFVNITTGTRDSANIQVLSGLNAGDTIITTGLMSLKPKAKVVLNRVVNEK